MMLPKCLATKASISALMESDMTTLLAFGAGVVASIVGAGVSLLRGGHRSWDPALATAGE